MREELLAMRYEITEDNKKSIDHVQNSLGKYNMCIQHKIIGLL